MLERNAVILAADTRDPLKTGILMQYRFGGSAMMLWHSLAYVSIIALFLSYVWFSCANVQNPLVMNDAAVVKFGEFVADVRSRYGVRLVPRWSGFHSYECEGACDAAGGSGRTYVLDFIVFGLDGREVCLSCTHPTWSSLSSCAGERGLALLAAEDRLWAQYAA